MNPISGLLHSRKFLLWASDALFSTVVLVCGWYFAPQELDKVVAVIAIIQPGVVMVIHGITAEDVAKLEAGVHPALFQPDKPEG